MSTFVNWIAHNQWVFKYVGYAAWGFDAFLLIDFIFGIHWIRDVIIPGIFALFLIFIYIWV